MSKCVNENDVFRQIQTIIGDLVGSGLCVDQNFPSIKKEKNHVCKVSISNDIGSVIMKNIPYRIVYYEMKEARSFHVCFVDQGLLLMQYEFHKGVLSKSRLLYMPNPDLLEFQNNEELYLDDSYELFADIVDKRIVVFPIRFDFDIENAKDLEHPASHLTLGQYKNCRIPMSAPMTPCHFVDFIVRNFYSTEQSRFEKKLAKSSMCFHDTITPLEKSVVHIQLPK